MVGLDMAAENQEGMTPGLLTCETGSPMVPFTQEEGRFTMTTDRAHLRAKHGSPVIFMIAL